MNPLDAFLSGPMGHALGWTLLHSVWQGALVALLLAPALYLLRGRPAQARYAAACAALALLMALPVATFCVLLPGAAETTATTALAEPAPAQPPGTVASGSAAAGAMTMAGQPQPVALLHALLPWLVVLWVAGVLTLSLRYLAGWTYTIRLRRRGTGAVGQRWHDQLARLTERMGVRRAVRLVSSARVHVPTVAGWLRPVILMPVSVFAGLTPQQVEMILAHELAHIRRHDYLVGLLQAVCETLLFYHPATWWLSARIRAEREHCCDDAVVAVCGDAYTYAAALAQLEHVRQASPRLALAASGGGRASIGGKR